MKPNPFATFRAFCISLVLLCFSPPLRAEQFGLFTYAVNDGATVIITGYPRDAVGPAEIPTEIAGRPVTRIGYNGFRECTGLTGVTIPSSVTGIGGAAFSGCTGLTSVTIPDGVTSIDELTFQACSALTSVTIPSSVAMILPFAFEGCSALTGITIPSSVIKIEGGAFSGCTGLTSVTLPEGVGSLGPSAFAGCSALTGVTIASSVSYLGGSAANSFGDGAFSGCGALTRAIFLGDAPTLGGGVFGGTAPVFTTYYLSGRSGFTSPTWNGYPATLINETVYPAASWLLAHSLWYDTDLHQDLDGDGVNLLMAYALDLDPRLNLQGSLPEPVLNESTLSLGFHATSPGITYRAETSTDLRDWTTTGVTQSVPGADGRSTASVLRDSANRFLRLVVGE